MKAASDSISKVSQKLDISKVSQKLDTFRFVIFIVARS